MAEKKKTKAEQWTEIKELPIMQENPEYVKFITDVITRLNKPKAESPKMKAEKEVREMRKADIVTSMKAGKKYRISDLISNVDSLVGLNPQAVTPLCTSLKKEGKIDNAKMKGASYYFLPGTLEVGGEADAKAQ